MEKRTGQQDDMFKKVVQSMALGKRYTLSDVVRKVQEGRSRPIEVQKVRDLPMGVTGLWVKGVAKDYILVPSQSSQAHIEHIVLHELAHMLLEHRPAIFEVDPARLAALLENTDPEAKAEFTRSLYSRPEEKQAETLATYLSSGMDISDSRTFWEDLRKQGTASPDEIVLNNLDQLLKGI